MHSIQMDRFDVDLSSERFEDYKKTSRDLLDLENKLRSFALIDFQLVQQFSDMHGFGIPQSMRMLEAHGGSDNNRYLYTDVIDNNRVWNSVIDWIDRHNGKYDALYICVCNPGGYIITPKDSTLIYPSTKIVGAHLFTEITGNGKQLLNITSKRGFENSSSGYRPPRPQASPSEKLTGIMCNKF